jgi:preprotein translocase subunit YajC
MQMDGQTGVRNVIIFFRSFAKAPRKTQMGISIHTEGGIRANIRRVRVKEVIIVFRSFAKAPRKTQMGTCIHTEGGIRASICRVRVAIM